MFSVLCPSVCSQSSSCRPIKLIPLALGIPIDGTQGRVPLHPLSMGQTQKVGIVCSLGPGPGLTPPLHTVRPRVPSSSPFPSTQTPLQCNTGVSLGPSPERRNGSTLQGNPSPSCATKHAVGRSSFAKVPHGPARLSATGRWVLARQTARAYTKVWMPTAKSQTHTDDPGLARVRKDNLHFTICARFCAFSIRLNCC